MHFKLLLLEVFSKYIQLHVRLRWLLLSLVVLLSQQFNFCLHFVNLLYIHQVQNLFLLRIICTICHIFYYTSVFNMYYSFLCINLYYVSIFIMYHSLLCIGLYYVNSFPHITLYNVYHFTSYQFLLKRL